jgi:hypothetical protein
VGITGANGFNSGLEQVRPHAGEAVGKRFTFVADDADKNGVPDDIMSNGVVIKDVRCVLDGIAVRSCGLLDCCHERGCSGPSVWGAARRNGVVAVRMRLSGLATGGPSRYACMRYLFGD